MRTHDEIIKAWLEGKDIEFKRLNSDDWILFTHNTTINPMTYSSYCWRVKQSIYAEYFDNHLINRNTHVTKETAYSIGWHRCLEALIETGILEEDDAQPFTS